MEKNRVATKSMIMKPLRLKKDIKYKKQTYEVKEVHNEI